uniref:Ku domain-containing protein n=1 Tax=Macaca nemestrina TaxID=9545 RepID=A0A2K6CY70_MACNE
MKKQQKKRTLKQCIQSVYMSKIISSDQDLYDTEKDKNSVNFKNIHILQELDNPGAKQILKLDQFKGQQGQKCFQGLMGHGSDYSFSEVLWVCAKLFSDVQFKMSHKKIMLFTNEDKPRGNDSVKACQASTKADDLRDIGIFFDLMHLKKLGGFNVSLFYRDIISIKSSKLEDLLQKVPLSRLKLKLNKDIVISVGIYNLVQKALKPPPIKLYRKTNEPVKTKYQTFNINTGNLLLPSDTKRPQIYGSHQIILEKEETEELKWFDEPALMLMVFKPLVMLKKHHYLRPSLFTYPEESLVNGSSTLFSALLIECLEKVVIALCRYTPCRNIPPYFVALVSQEEELDDQKIQVTTPGFQLVFLPFVPFTEKVMATPEQVGKMKAIVQKLCFTYRSDSFENPVLQQHFTNLEPFTLYLMEAEQAVDLTLPKVEEMNKILGSMVNEFKELGYSADYNPEGKITKRKHNNEYSEDELKTHISKGTLGNFTGPIMKEYWLKKQELLEVLTKHFQDCPEATPPATLPHCDQAVWPCSQPVKTCFS